MSDSAPATTPALPARRRAVLFILIGGVLVLYVVAVQVQARTTWYPQADLAMTELHVRDVATSHPPLLGLVGRIGNESPSRGAHPGPMSFYSLWPVYRLLGAKPWALLAAAASLQVIATGAALWIALRRGGIRLALGVCAVIVAIMWYLGPSVMTQPSRASRIRPPDGRRLPHSWC